jgi:thioesterase domain-containing protein/acyl carrier protein
MRTAEPADARFIGRPLANTQAFVLDDARGPLPIGVAGELYLGGDGLADGYLNRPDETAERFVANPFAEEPGIGSARMYRTGDRVRWTRDGALEFLGRADDQVKLRGFRIELGEVEAALRAVPGVAEAAVAIWEPTVDDRRLVAYFVPAASGPGGVTPVDLRRAVESRLPAYMVPSRFIAMTGLPRTPNNKVDRRALPMPAAEEPSAAVSLPARIDPVSPPPIAAATLPPGVDADRRQQWDGRPRIQWTTTQRDLARIWRRILHIRTIDIEDSFFELGGHSLLAVRMLQEVATVFRVRVPVRTLFRAQTIVDLAAELELLITERRPSDSADTGEQGPPQVREHVRATGPVSDNAVPRFVVPIRLPSRSAAVRPPLFCLHHVYGVILAYRALARHLGNDQPVYGIQHPGVDGDDEGAAPDTTVEAMAARYVNAIRRLWPDGPYYLCGQSFGGVLAFEMARQLERDRLPVAFVGMLDTYAPTYFRTEEADLPERALLARLPGLLATTRSLPATERRDFWNSIVLNAVLRRLDPGHVAADDVTSLAGELAVIRARCMEAQRVYEATPLHIPVTLFRGVERLDMRTPDPHLWWDPLTPAGLHVVQVPGNHHSMMREPLVKRTAAAIRAAMDAAGAAASVATPSAEPDVASHRELASASR